MPAAVMKSRWDFLLIYLRESQILKFSSTFFSVMHLLSFHLVFSLPRPHAAVRFLSLLRKNWSSAKRNWRGRNPTIMLRRVPQPCCGTIDACGGPESPLPLRSAPCLCATGTRHPFSKGGGVKGRSLSRSPQRAKRFCVRKRRMG